MIEVMNLGTNVIACRVTGKIDRDDLNLLSEEIDRKAANGAPIRVYAEIGDLSFMNLISVSQDLKSWSHRQDLVHQINRAAVVTDSGLIKRGMPSQDKLPASLEVKLFGTADKEQARRWIEE